MPQVQDGDGGGVLLVGPDADAVATGGRGEVDCALVVGTEDEGVGGGVGQVLSDSRRLRHVVDVPMGLEKRVKKSEVSRLELSLCKRLQGQRWPPS